MLAVLLVLPLILAGCWTASPQVVSPAGKNIDSPGKNTVPASKAGGPVVPVAGLPATWTPTPLPAGLVAASARTPSPTPNYSQTLAAQTTVASGVRCKRAPQSWRVYSSPAASYAGWCLVLGRLETIYEYRLVAPDNWMVTTFGETHPNLAFATGYKNVQLRLYQAYSYRTRNWEGTLEEAPEKAYHCDENERCLGYISPQETLVRQQMTTSGDRNILVLDSNAGELTIRRYYQILPFKFKKHESMRLFILEFTYLNGALDDDQIEDMLEKIDTINRSLWQR
jgi:hypothetical protein